MERLEIKVDVIGQMANTRQTFADRYAFVDEVVQNAQRAKAENLYFKVENNRITIEDDGPGVSDLNHLFTQSLSGWDQATKDAENPFGFGFFACIVVANKITVQSHGVEAVFDVAKMFKEKRTDVVDVHRSDVMLHRGLRIILEDLIDVDAWKVERRVKKLARYIEVKVHLAGREIEKFAFDKLTPNEESQPLTMTIRHKGYQGVLYPERWSSGVNTYLCGRPVADVWVQGLGGRINVDPQTMNARCPDRKAWIEDSKFYKFRTKLRKHAKALMIEMVKRMDDDTIDAYADSIMAHVGAEEYRKHLTFELEELPAEVNAVVNATKEQLAEAKSIDALLAAQEYKPENKPDHIAEIEPEIEADEPTTGSAPVAPIASQPASERPSPSMPEPPTREGKSYRALRQCKLVFWVAREDVLNNVEKIREAKYYGARVLVVRHKLQRKVIEDMPNVQHISRLDKDLRKGMNLLERGPLSPEEARAEQLMKAAVSAVYEHATLEIANVEFYTECYLNGKSTGHREIAKDTLAAHKGPHIVIQRGTLPLEYLEGISLTDTVGPMDRAFLMKMLDSLAHELAHVVYGVRDGDKEFYEAQLVVQAKLIDHIFNREALLAEKKANDSGIKVLKIRLEK